MAGYKGHVAGAFVFGSVYIVGLMTFFSLQLSSYQGHYLHGWQFAAALFILAMLFGLWPDVDTNSKGQDIFYVALFTVDSVLLLTKHEGAAAYLGLLAMLPVLSKHRGWTHSRISMILVPLPILLFPILVKGSNWHWAILYYGAAFTGYFSHLFLDGRIVSWFRIKGHGYRS